MGEGPPMTEKEFDDIAEDVWAKLQPHIPAELKEHFHKIRISIENRPSAGVLAELAGTGLDGNPLDLCGLHVGVPLTEESMTYPSLFPARVYLFREAILAMAEYDGSEESLDDVREEIAITLLHEVGHFFGLEEDDLERLGFD